MDIQNTTLDDVAAVVGFSATLRLSAWYGDTYLYVPIDIPEDHALVKLIGHSAAVKLSQEWPGEHLAVPRLTAYEHDVRRKIIARMLEQKFGTREIANHLRISERRVQQITRELEVAGLIDVVKPPSKKEQKLGPVSSVFELGETIAEK